MAAMISKRRPRHHGHHRPQFRPLIRANSKLSTIVIIDILKLAPIKVSDKLVSLTTSKVVNILNSKARVRTLIPQEASQKTNSTLQCLIGSGALFKQSSATGRPVGTLIN